MNMIVIMFPGATGLLGWYGECLGLRVITWVTKADFRLYGFSPRNIFELGLGELSY